MVILWFSMPIFKAHHMVFFSHQLVVARHLYCQALCFGVFLLPMFKNTIAFNKCIHISYFCYLWAIHTFKNIVSYAY